MEYLQVARQNRPELAAHLQRLESDPQARNLDLPSYLLKPSASFMLSISFRTLNARMLIARNPELVQRLTKYPLLIDRIIDHTESKSERNRLIEAKNVSLRLLGEVNETIRDRENRQLLKKVSENLWVGQGYVFLLCLKFFSILSF